MIPTASFIFKLIYRVLFFRSDETNYPRGKIDEQNTLTIEAPQVCLRAISAYFVSQEICISQIKKQLN